MDQSVIIEGNGEGNVTFDHGNVGQPDPTWL